MSGKQTIFVVSNRRILSILGFVTGLGVISLLISIPEIRTALGMRLPMTGRAAAAPYLAVPLIGICWIGLLYWSHNNRVSLTLSENTLLIEGFGSVALASWTSLSPFDAIKWNQTLETKVIGPDVDHATMKRGRIIIFSFLYGIDQDLLARQIRDYQFAAYQRSGLGWPETKATSTDQ